MFLGEFQHTIDSKGRVSIPAKFRQFLKEGAVVTRGIGDHCLFIYSKDEFEKLAQKIALLPIGKADSRALARQVLAGAANIEIDKLGRALIPDYLRQYAKIKKTVVLAGLFNRIEIWDSEEWELYKRNTEKGSEEIAEKLGELGI
jgi:MraZ protein